MSLSLAYDIARGSLSANSTSTSVVSRNIANVDNPNAARKSVGTTASASGVHVSGISSAVDMALFESVLESSSAQAEMSTISTSLDRLNGVIGDPELGLSAAALLADLQSSLQAAAALPQDDVLARKVVTDAAGVVDALHTASDLIGKVRSDANAEIASAVGTLDELLQKFEKVNSQIVVGTVAGTDVTDQIDTRNRLLRDMSELVDVRPMVRANNDMVIFAASGATIFETVPRSISFDSSMTLQPGQPGGELRIDGVLVSGAAASRLGGKIGGLLQVRDETSLVFGSQLDEIARGLIVAFAESDQSASPSLPDLAGLFTYPGGPGLPPSGVVAHGLAASIVVNPNVDPSQGGDPTLLRDGGISDPGNPNYIYNATGNAGFSDRLRGLMARMSETQAFDAATGLPTQANLLNFAADSAGWLSNARSTYYERLQDTQAINERATGAWQGRIGVNLDEELTALIALERSFQATSRLITTVNGMFDSLFRAV